MSGCNGLYTLYCPDLGVEGMKTTYRILMIKLRKVFWPSGMSPSIAVWMSPDVSKQCDAFIFKGSRSISNAKELGIWHY